MDPLVLCRDTLTSFAIAMKNDYETPRHVRLIAKKLEQLEQRKIKRLMIFIGPRHGKSFLTNEIFPAWYFGRNPTHQIITTSYSQEIASGFGRKVRTMISDPKYQAIFPGIKTDADSFAAHRFNLTTGGVYYAVGAGGPLTSRGADCLTGEAIVSTPDGLYRIDHLVKSEYRGKILSWNHERNECEFKDVVASRRTTASRIFEIRTDKGRKIRSTGDHPIFVLGQGYKKAYLLKPGDRIKIQEIQSKQGQPKKRFTRKFNNSLCALPCDTSSFSQDAISSIKEISGIKNKVYDLQVEGNHNFFANGILVHNCIIIDDIHKNRAEASSAAYQKRIQEWFGSVLYTRLAPNGVIVLIQTRWHESDLPGFLLQTQKDEWDVLTLPAISEKGEALWPERFPIQTLEEIKRTIGLQDFTALYQQTPSPAEGNLIKRQWFKFYSILPELDTIVMSADLTFKEGKNNDFSVFQVWGKRGADKFFLDQIRGRMGFSDQLKAFRSLSAKWPNCTVKLVEEAANAAALIDTLRKEIPGIVPVKPRGSKINRAQSVAPQFESGNIYLPDKVTFPEIQNFIEEWVTFPNGQNDDQVDASVYAIERLTTSSSFDFEPVSITKSSYWSR